MYVSLERVSVHNLLLSYDLGRVDFMTDHVLADKEWTLENLHNISKVFLPLKQHKKKV